ncbi:retropepsin-like aspartic protease family protein [Litoreibacter janthinus]|uniref:Aspartyl protease family protein n=1 Tax=Litoreibacter janthinus TaxID=670154 RepID=A0A1I6H022_9RHOB|nr:TIGR02281 family clan AA aspartic protease [Litoreibacter janthinus]SFR47816.1 aspartyl protease family protein [Litoreibacter janthinus]
MDSEDTARLIYLVLLGSVIAGYFLISNRARMGEAARQAALWGFIFIGVIVAYGLWSDVSQTVLPQQSTFEGGRIEVPVRTDGHYHLTLHVGEVPIEFVVDTGASGVVLSQEDAAQVGIDTDTLIYGGRASTANGEVRTARVTLENVRLGKFQEGRVRAYVNEGELANSLLGMDYLERFNRIEIQRGKLVLER